MSTKIDVCDEAIESLDILNWALQSKIWNGREVFWTEASEFRDEAYLGILDRLFENQSPAAFDQLASQLAWIGTPPANRAILARDIQVLDFSNNEIIAVPAGLGKSISKVWRKHKTAILIGVAVVSVITTIAVVAVTSGGTAAGIATAAGGEVLSRITKKDSEKGENKAPHSDVFTNIQKPESLSLPPITTFFPENFSTSDAKVIFGENGISFNGQYSSYANIVQFLKTPPKVDAPFSWPSLPVGEYIPNTVPTFQSHQEAFFDPKIPQPVLPNVNTPPPQDAPISKSWILSIFETMGRGMVDSDLLHAAMSAPKQEPSSLFATIGEKRSHLGFGGINGINTSWEEALAHAEYIAKLTGKKSIDWVYNRSHGPVVDLLEVFSLNYMGVSPNTSQLLMENWTAFHMRNGNHPDAKYLQFCHSQGAIHVRNALSKLPKEIRDRVIVVAIAPAAVVSKKLCYESYNYACKGDVVPYGEMVFFGAIDTNECGTSKAMERALEAQQEIIWLEPHPDTKSAHDFQGPTFARKISKHVKEYLKHNGEYK